jgi:hypothetical protein
MYRVRALVGLGRGEAARADAEAALHVATRAMKSDDPAFAEYLNALGRAELESGRAPQAVTPLERALTLRLGHVSQFELADTRFLLAGSLWQSGADRARARALAREAAAGLQTTELSIHRDEVQRWLAAHP